MSDQHGAVADAVKVNKVRRSPPVAQSEFATLISPRGELALHQQALAQYRLTPFSGSDFATSPRIRAVCIVVVGHFAMIPPERAYPCRLVLQERCIAPSPPALQREGELQRIATRCNALAGARCWRYNALTRG
jgi:hypothetical protein